MKTLKYLLPHLFLLVLLLSPTFSESTPPTLPKSPPQNLPESPPPTLSGSSPPTPDGPPSPEKIIVVKKEPVPKVISITQLPEKTGFSLTLIPSDKPSPNLFVSKSEKKPTEESNDFSLKDKNGGSLFLSNEDLKGVKQLSLIFVCPEENCEADFSIDFAKVFEINADGLTHNFQEEINGIGSMILKMKVPKKDNANRLVIHADSVPNQKGWTPYVNLNIQRDQDSKSSSSIINKESISRSAWYAGKTAVIYKDSESFCTDCSYTISLKFLPLSQVRVQADLLPDKLEIKRDSYLDGVEKDAYNVYSFTFNKDEAKKNDVIIDLQAQKGSIKVFIDCDKEPENYKQYSQIFEIYDIEDRIVLKKEDHSDLCISSGYTIVVFGRESSIYNIKASENQGHDLVLGEGTPVKGQIAPSQQIDYEVLFPFYMTGQLKIQLQTQGNIDLSISKCITATDCPSIISQDYSPIYGSDSAYTPDPAKFEVKNIEGGKEVLLDALKNRCFPLVVKIPGLTGITEQRCVYKVTIKSTDASKQDYSLSASYTGHQILYVGKPATGQVLAGESKLYQIYIPHKKLESLSFQLSTLSGHAKIFVSKTESHPLKSEDATIDHEDAVIFKDKKDFYYLGLFYITVRGVFTSTYTLTATAISSDGNPIDYATELTQGIPHKGVIDMDKKDLTHFYKFKLDLPSDWRGTIKIVSTTLHGSIYLGVNNNDEVPTAGITNFRSTTKNGLEISSTNEFFSNRATYLIGVFPDLSDANSIDLKKIVYSLTFFLLTINENQIESNKQQHMILTSASSYHDTITKNRVLYFKVPILSDDNSLFITKKDDNKDLDIYLSMNSELLHPDPYHFDKCTKESHTAYIELTRSELSQIRQDCPEYECFVYLSVTTTSDHQIPFTLSLEKQHASQPSLDIIIPTTLTEGEERLMKFPENGQFAYFVFYPLPGKDTYIDILCPNKNINLYANLQKGVSTGDQLKTVFNFPNANKHDYTTITDENLLNTGAAHLIIPKGNDESKSSVITIMLSFEDHYTHGTPPADPTTYSIVAASDIRYIHSGIPYYGNIKEGDYQYFVMDVDLDECQLIVALESLDDGDSDLLVSYGKEKRPTVKDHDHYSSSSVRSEIIELDKKIIYPLKTMKGQWVFGVYGQTTGRFSLTVVYQHKKIIQLYPAYPTEWYSKSNSEFYFTYYHELDGPLNIRIDKQSGHLNVYIKTLNPHQDLSENLPTLKDHTWTLDADKNNLVHIDNKDEKFCFKCLYVIAIKIEKGSKFSILAYNEKIDIPSLKNSFVYSEHLEPGETRKYKITFSNSDKVYLNTRILQGSINVYALNNPIVSKTHFMWKDALGPKEPSHILELDKAVYDKAEDAKSKLSPDGKEWVFSQRDFFYFYFVNEGTDSSEFKFSVYSEESTLVLPLGESYSSLFAPEEETAFLVYSPHNGGVLTLTIDFCVPQKAPKDSDEETPEFDVGVTSWSDKTTAGTGKKVDLTHNRADPKGESISDEGPKGKKDISLCTQQVVEFDDRIEESRYKIVLTSPFKEKILANILVESSMTDHTHISMNVVRQEIVSGGETKNYEVSLPGGGFWYFNMIACSGDVSVQYGEDVEAEEYKLNPEGPTREIFIKEQIKNAERKYLKVNVEGDDLGASLLMTSAYFNENKIYPFNVDAETNELQLTYNYDYKGDDSVLEIAFPAPVLKGYGKLDTNTFDIRLCLKEYANDGDDVCAALNKNSKCESAVKSGEIQKTSMISHRFEGVFPGEYQLSILRSVKHSNHFVRSFVFKNVEIVLKESFLTRIWDFTVVLFSGIFLILAIYFVCSKVRNAKVDPEESLRKSPKKKGYGFVGEDEEDNDDNNLRKDN